MTEVAGKPVVEVEVCAEAIDKSHFKCIQTRTDGTYELTGLAAGEYKVGFWTTRNYVVQFWESRPTWAAAKPVVVAAGRTTPDIGAVLEVGATISGTVTAAATGAPVGEVEACATFAQPELERCAQTNAAGQYTIDGLDGLVEGAWKVYFYAEKAEVDVVSQSYPSAIQLGPQQALTGVNAALIPGGQIAGTVRLASTGEPLGGVLVCATTSTSSMPLACVRTPSSGAYRFTRVWPGSFKVVFSPEPKELFGPEDLGEAEAMEREEAAAGHGPDPYPTQWWGGQATFAAAAQIAITPPAIVNDVDASLLAPPPPAPAPAAAATPVAKKPVRKCKRGFVKRKVHGKPRCVKRHKAKPKPRPRRHKAPQPRPKRP